MDTSPMRQRKHLLFTICLLITLVFATQLPMTAQLYSVAFKTNNPSGNSPAVSGNEAAATAANPAFGAANVWNNLFSPYALQANPSWSNLVSSTGTASNVGFSITGTFGPADLTPWEPAPDPIRSAFLFWNSWQNGLGAYGPGESSTITWKLTGLQSNATYAMFFYGGLADTDRFFDMTVGGTTQQVWSYNDNAPHPLTGTYFTTVYSDAGGSISGIGAGVGSGWSGSANEADWSGFQIVEVSSTTPEPTSLLMLGSGVLGLAGVVRRKLSL